MIKRGKKPEKHSVERYAEALHATGGVLAKAAKNLKVSRATIYNAVARHPELAQVRDEARETVLDLAESTLIKAIRRGELRAATYYLDRKGKARGYGRPQ